jgi:hypothetical protein
MASHEHKCPTCDHIFNSFSELRKHKAQAHDSKDKKTCPICQVCYNATSQIRGAHINDVTHRDNPHFCVTFITVSNTPPQIICVRCEQSSINLVLQKHWRFLVKLYGFVFRGRTLMTSLFLLERVKDF